MPITVVCPQGHRLSCAEELAGGSTKCPKCGTTVRVPAASDSEIGLAPLDDSKANLAAAKLIAAKSATPVSGSVTFLCPNGHKLNAPRAMEGKPGKCPHCGARFIIPSDEDEEDDAISASELDDPLSGSSISQRGASAGSFSGRRSPSDSGTLHTDEFPQHEGTAMGELFQQLWNMKGEQGVVEIRLRSGMVLIPKHYSARASRPGCGVIAIQELDGKYHLCVVNWSAVENVRLKGLSNIPTSWFS
jgi:hypothetical protein